jgi:hypothetical protein
MPSAGAEGNFTRGVVFVLDPTPAQERLLRSYCGAARVAHNWAISRVKENLAARSAGRAAGVGEDRLTPSWSPYSLSKRCNESKDKKRRLGRSMADVSLGQFAAPRNIAREGARLLAEQRSAAEQHVAGPRPETQNADLRSRQTSGAQASLAVFA